MTEGVHPLAPVRQIVADVVAGRMSETLACFYIEKHLELARTPRGVTRRDQIAALVLPAIMAHAPHVVNFADQEGFERYCVARAYSMADAASKVLPPPQAGGSNP